MNLFKKSSEEVKSNTNKDAEIKILGSGCPKCRALENATILAMKELNINKSIYHVTDFEEIASYGVMSTPALVVDGKVVSVGKVLSVDEIKDLLI